MNIKKIHHYRDNEPKRGWGEAIKSFRWHVLGLYQKDFAKLLNISQESLSRIERGLYQPREDIIERFTGIVYDAYLEKTGRDV